MKINLPPNFPQRYYNPPVLVDKGCKACSLSTMRAVSASSGDDIRLIVISDHPGHYEEKFNFCQVPVNLISMRRSNTFKNSGQLIREVIEKMYGLDPWEHVYYTNALKCDPKGKAISDTAHISVCAGQWLAKEMMILPKVPMIVAGFKAYTAIRFLYPQCGLSGGLNNNRRKVLVIDDRPTIFTFNPAAVAKNEFRVPVNYTVQASTGELMVCAAKETTPLPGSPMWIFLKDLEILRHFFL